MQQGPVIMATSSFAGTWEISLEDDVVCIAAITSEIRASLMLRTSRSGLSQALDAYRRDGQVYLEPDGPASCSLEFDRRGDVHICSTDGIPIVDFTIRNAAASLAVELQGLLDESPADW